MPPRAIMERSAREGSAPQLSNFKSPEEELHYLRERVAEQARELDVRPTPFEQERIAKRELAEYAEQPSAKVLHEEIIMPEHETVRHVLKLEPETHDVQLDALFQIVSQRGIKNALGVVARLNNPHIEDDFHRALIRYIAEGLPDSGTPLPEKVKRALHMVLFEIQPQAHGDDDKQQGQQKLEQLLSSSEQLYGGLSSMVDAHEGFSLEIAVPEGSEEAFLYLAVPRTKQTLAERLISSVFPNARISEQRGDYNVFNVDGHHAAAYAELKMHPAFPLKTPEMFEHDPLNLLLAAFSKIQKHGEGAALQITISNEGDRYNNHYKKIIRQIEKGQHVEKALRIAESDFGEALHEAAHMIFRPTAYEEEKERERAVRNTDQVATEEISRKVKSRIAPVSIRLITSAPTEARATDLLENLIVPFSQYEDPRGNSLIFNRVSAWKLTSFLRDFTYREFDHSIAMPISLAEVTAMFHFTAERVATSRELKKSYAKQIAAPVDVSQADGITIGINQYGATETPVRFSPADRLRHCYVIGQTGTGKSGLLQSMIIQDMKNGDGVAFIDPHGNDIENILAAVPPERMKDVIYFDPAHTARPMGLNMLEYDRSKPEMKTFVVDEVYGIFRQLYSDVPEAFGPMFEQYYRNAVQLVVEDPDSGSTFLEIPRVFADAAFRNLKLSRCNNPVIVQFWRKIAEAAGGDAGLENVAPYITSKFDVFLANDIMRPIVAQEQSAFNFRDIMDSKKIFLANLSKGRLGDKNASLLGLVLVSKFLQAAFSRVDAASATLPTYYLYIDEFQNFATPSISTILSEARKYKLSLTVAHQFIAQLEDEIRDSVIGNVGTKIAMRIGTTDAEFLEKQFAPNFNAKDLENLPNRTGIAALLVGGMPVQPFTIRTMDLPQFDYSHTDALKQLSYETYGKNREEVEAEIRQRFGQGPSVPPPAAPLDAASLYQ